MRTMGSHCLTFTGTLFRRNQNRADAGTSASYPTASRPPGPAFPTSPPDPLSTRWRGGTLPHDSVHRRIPVSTAGTPALATLVAMPEISRFFGLVIQMYYDDHEPPHVHARHGSAHAKIRLSPVELLGGHVPSRHLALVLQWARLHEAELMECWLRIQRDLPPGRIAPLE